MRLEQQYLALAAGQQPAAAAGTAAAAGGPAAATATGGGGARLLSGRSALSPVQADILSRRYEELRSRHSAVCEENAALRRSLAALRSVAPELVASLEFPLMPAGSGAAAAAPEAMEPPAASGIDGPAAAAGAVGLTVAGTLRPGTAGRVRPQSGGGGGSDAGAASSPPPPPGPPSPGGLSPLRRGVGASGARPPSAATYALRAGGGGPGLPGYSPAKRPLSSRPSGSSAGGSPSGGPWTGGSSPAAAAAAVASPPPPLMAVGSGGLSAATGVALDGVGSAEGVGAAAAPPPPSPPPPGAASTALAAPLVGGGGAGSPWRLSAALSGRGSATTSMDLTLAGLTSGPPLEVTATRVVGTPSRPGSAYPPPGRRA
ncbi:hypothetical protein GPECTOR_1g426 [Gonium pectorale]|uniref:Uncharacterized protein n=1 Tax=Gonium pectorale TaxID=33097 RepID=A0A150H2R9_GONPE|nr:hypothetical protein GPECTOR_1g426 [Gonium pectorale]|eukprot:KXZ56476.1 hypothetical protein GPECTOR_1g426 [Gonium pectorale]